jgi:hypothetical protein
VVVQTCDECHREFALTVAHAEGRLRDFDDGPLAPEEAERAAPRCDFCEAKTQILANPTAAVFAGLQQATCPHCHSEFLSGT